MGSNNGFLFEEEIYILISLLIKNDQFLLSPPNIKVRRKPKYYSRDREAEIECDVSVEKYLENPNKNRETKPSIIVVIECKDYSGPIPVDDIEEFHAKLQQIGADNTKGILITRNGYFQKSALSYARAKGIALARMQPDNKINFATYYIRDRSSMDKSELKECMKRSIKELTEKNYEYSVTGFASSTGELSLVELIIRCLQS